MAPNSQAGSVKRKKKGLNRPLCAHNPNPDESQLEGQELMDAIRRRRNAEAYRTDMAAVISILKRR